MCGIFAVFGHQGEIDAFRSKAVQLSKLIRHRGPDWSGVYSDGKNVICHERLAIVGVESGAQPLISADGNIVLCVNGEIYNHIALQHMVCDKVRKQGKPEPVFKTGSDCEVIIALWQEYGPDMIKYLDGMFSFVLYDKLQDRYIATRDAIGVTTLYQGTSRVDGSVWFASEMKSLFQDTALSSGEVPVELSIKSFEPGTWYDSKTGKSQRWYNPAWFTQEPSKPVQDSIVDGRVAKFPQKVLDELKSALVNSVRMHMMAEVPYGVLLSGGLDSSLIAAIAARETTKAAASQSPRLPEQTMWSQKVHSFSIGLENSPDLLAARKVAKHIGTRHHEFNFTVQEGLDAIRDVIWHLETYDVTTIRASTPMYLLSRKIKAMGVKMVLSGEGADEIFGGYLYFHESPDAASLHQETIARVKLLHTSDCLRANKSTLAWGLEARVPFLTSTQFMDVAMSLAPEYKHPKLTPRGIEKEILRQAFDVSEDDGTGNVLPFLPADILWRQKEQFSDGVGYNWIDSLKQWATNSVSDKQFQERSKVFPYETPTTKEAFHYRRIFEQLFCPDTDQQQGKLDILKTVVRWIPRKDWGCQEDPSGRAQKAHTDRKLNLDS